MATSFESSNVPCAYTTISRLSGQASPAEASTAEAPPAETSPTEGLQDAPTYQYTGVRDLQERVKSQSTELLAGRSNQQYLVFRSVTKGQLDTLDRKRASIGKHTRMSHYTDTNLLVVKLMPSAQHEITHLSLGRYLDRILAGMGLPVEALTSLGGTTFFGPNSSKEGDSSYKPRSRRRADDWPTLVFESGLSESLTRLRQDASWWLANSGGDVKIVIIISITPVEKRLRIEKWCLSSAPGYRPATRALSNPNPLVPTRIQEVTITQNPAAQPGTTTVQPGATASYTVTGAPLILKFQNLLLRAPIPPEGDVVFSAADLLLWADAFWESVS